MVRTWTHQIVIDEVVLRIGDLNQLIDVLAEFGTEAMAILVAAATLL